MKTLNLRNSTGRSPSRLAFLMAFALACFWLLPKVQAVVPAPDGGYPGANTAEGQNALFSLTTGGYNTALGYYSLKSDTTGSFNTGVGAGTLFANNGFNNTATGAGALLSNTTGNSNTANGAFALFSNTGNNNTANGYNALLNNTQGFANTATGSSALRQNTGVANTADGNGALMSVTTGSGNTGFGYLAGNNVTTAGNVICIGYNVAGANVSDTCFIGNIRGVTTINNNAVPVVIDSAGQLGTLSSSLRFKKEIKPMDKASEALLGLRPVTFQYKSDNTGTPQFGLIAEEVAKANPDLVVRDENGEIYTVRYEAINAMLLNEFLKEHRKVEKLEATVAQQQKETHLIAAQQQKEIQALAATVKEQASEIQKVSAQLELQKAAPQTVLNNQ